MPLLLTALASELISVYDKGPAGNLSGVIVGLGTARAYLTYCTAGMDVGGSPCVTMPGSIQLGEDIGKTLSKPNISPAQVASEMQLAYQSCLNTFKTVYQTTIITVTGAPALNTHLNLLFSGPISSPTLFAIGLALALDTFTMSALVSGFIPATPPIPFIGPIS